MDLDSAAWLLVGLDLVGVFAFALSGGLTAVRKEFDLFGVVVLSLVAGLGGGILRDVLIGDVPPAGISDWRLLGAATAAGVVTFFLHPGVSRSRRIIDFLDAVGLGFFAVAGTLKALELGSPTLTAVIVGVLTGVGGGMIRDLLAGDVPEVLRHRELYALPALAGVALFSLTWELGWTVTVTSTVSAVLITGLRLAATRWQWQAPAPRSRPWS